MTQATTLLTELRGHLSAFSLSEGSDQDVNKLQEIHTAVRNLEELLLNGDDLMIDA